MMLLITAFADSLSTSFHRRESVMKLRLGPRMEFFAYPRGICTMR
jgi:hypothetical protein